MRNRSTLMALLLVAAFGAWIAPEAVAEENEMTVALRGLDPIALIEGRQVQGQVGLTTEHAGLAYRFADRSNLEKFEGDPERYAIQGDGTCLMSPGSRINPDIFAVHDGRIYAFATEHCVREFEADPARFLDPAATDEAGRTRKVAVFLYQGVELLDFSGPGEVFAAAEGFEVFTVAATADPVLSQGFVEVTPQYTIDNAPKADVLVLPGGATGTPLADEKVIRWIRESAENLEVAMSVCTGAFLLAKAGLLDGKQATTWHGQIQAFREYAPRTEVLENTRFVDNGKIVTTAGVSAGIDGALHVVARLKGEKVAASTARYMEYDQWVPGRGTVVELAHN